MISYDDFIEKKEKEKAEKEMTGHEQEKNETCDKWTER